MSDEVARKECGRRGLSSYLYRGRALFLIWAYCNSGSNFEAALSNLCGGSG